MMQGQMVSPMQTTPMMDAGYPQQDFSTPTGCQQQSFSKFGEEKHQDCDGGADLSRLLKNIKLPPQEPQDEPTGPNPGLLKGRSLIPPSPHMQQVAQMDRLRPGQIGPRQAEQRSPLAQDSSTRWHQQRGYRQQQQQQQTRWNMRSPQGVAQQEWNTVTATPNNNNRMMNQSAEASVSNRSPVAEADWTTVMLRNVPNKYTTDMLKETLDAEGFAKAFDFLYLPMDFRNHVNIGYAFINSIRPETARQFMSRMQGFERWMLQSRKVGEVSWSHPHQGLAEHIERYRNSPVMHPSMPSDYKPRLYVNGNEVPFPIPTKHVKPPKLRPARGQDESEMGQ